MRTARRYKNWLTCWGASPPSRVSVSAPWSGVFGRVDDDSTTREARLKQGDCIFVTLTPCKTSERAFNLSGCSMSLEFLAVPIMAGFWNYNLQ